MAAEIIAAVQAANAAFTFIQKAVHKGREVQDLTKALGAFWDAREKVSIIEQEATNPSKIQKLFGGNSVESQALEITLQKKKAIEMEQQLRDIFIMTGNGHYWEDMIRERSRIRNLRIAAAKQKAQSRAAMIDIAVILAATTIGTFLVYFTYSLLSGAVSG